MVQVNNAPINLRLKFTKTGSLQYISHLDLVRTMNKTVVRAGLPLWYTEGFNPKPKLVFAAPLSIGTESLCEYLDIRLTHRMPISDAIEAMNRNLTPEMQVVLAYYPDGKLTDMKWMEYSILIKTEGASEELCERCVGELMKDSVLIWKKAKNGSMKQVDIRPLIKSCEASLIEDAISLRCILSADQSSFLNPEHVISVLRESCGILSDKNLLNESWSIRRDKALFDDLTEFR